MSDLIEINDLATALLQSLAPGARRKLLHRIARETRNSQSERIRRQQQPDGSPFARKREPREPKLGAFAVRFLYPKGAANARVAFMKSWVRQGPLMTGFDIEAGAIRSFFWDQADFLPVSADEQNRGAGKLRRKGRLREKVMFRKLRLAKYLQKGVEGDEAWIGFADRAAAVARVHQEGLEDRPSLKGKKVRYAQRVLLGLTNAEQDHILDMLVEAVTPS